MVGLISGGQADLIARITIPLCQVYRPPSSPGVWIEHGHQHDRCNCFFVGEEPYWSAERPPILTDREGCERLLECVGTRFLVRFLNALDAAYPYVDNVKPFSRFLGIFGASALQPGYAPIKATLAVWGMLRYLGHTLAHRPPDLLGMPHAKKTGPVDVLRQWVEEMPAVERSSLAERLRGRGFELETSLPLFLWQDESASRLLDFLSDHPDLASPIPADDPPLLCSGASPRAFTGNTEFLELGSGFTADETGDLCRAAKSALRDPSVEAVIMGHTHETVNRPQALPYINTGCWTRYYRFANDEPLRAWPLLRSPTYSRFPYQLNYAEITPGTPPSTRMVTFRERSHDSVRQT
jgi:hypothetical protein